MTNKKMFWVIVGAVMLAVVAASSWAWVAVPQGAMGDEDLTFDAMYYHYHAAEAVRAVKR